MSSKTDFILKVLHVLSWILFVGLGIDAGGLITKTVATLMLPHDAAAKFYKAVDLEAVYRFDETQYVMLASLMIIVVVLKAILFYMIVRLLHSKKFTLSKPFNVTINRFLINLGYLSLAIGIFSFSGANVADGVRQQGVDVPDLRDLKLAGSDVWLFMAVLLFVVGNIFKKGVEIQNENDLTV
jgi:DUF2975 family protein